MLLKIRKADTPEFLREITVMSVENNKRLFPPCYEFSEGETVTKAVVKNSVRAVQKFKKKMSGKTVVIAHGNENSKSLIHSSAVYENYSYERILPVLNTICRQTALKYRISVPFEDFYIMASPVIACRIIEHIYDLSRIFTIVSDEETYPGIYDELYFKHGTLIRQLPYFNNNIAKDSVLIRCNAASYPSWKQIPVIDMSPMPVCGNLCVKVGEIYVYDEGIEACCRAWGGISGIKLYELMGKYPHQNSGVNINKKADEIFLLDMKGI